MKKVSWILPVFISLFFFSCQGGEASFTPYIQISNLYLNPVYSGSEIIAAEDTLSLTASGGVYVIDTISMGDTVVFAAAFGSISNDLTAIRCNFDTLQLNMAADLSGDLSKVLLPTTNLRQLQLEIAPGYIYATVPMGYSPMQSGTYDFTLKVESDSKFSPTAYTFRQPIR